MIIRTAIRRPVAVAMTYVVIASLGFLAWRNMPLELMPETALPQLSVQASYPGASPEVTEAFVTSPLEAAIQQVQGVDSISSVSTEGRAAIQVKFDRDADMDFARLELSERLASLEDVLPDGVRPTVDPYVPSEFQESLRPLLVYQITGPFTLEYQREYLLEEVSEVLLRLRGVEDVRVSGGRDRVFNLVLDEDQTRALGLTLDAVRQRIIDLEWIKEAGHVGVADGTLRTIAIRETVGSTEEILNTPLLTNGGRIVRVRDVADAYETWTEPTGYNRINSNPAVTMQIYRAHGTNAVQVADSVIATLAGLEPHFPGGMRMELIRNQSDDIEKQLTDLGERAVVSAVVVMLVLLVFLRDVRAAVIVFTTVAFAVLITINAIYFLGFSLNILTLMGLAMGFGLVVDNAIVVLENIFRHRKQGVDATEAAERGATEVVLPILAATATTVIVVVPFVYLQGALRVYYVPLAVVVGISLVASLFVAFTFIPSLGSRLFKGVKRVLPGSGQEPGGVRAATEDTLVVRAYGGLIRGSVRYWWATLIIAMTMLGGSYYLFDRYVTRGRVWGGGFGGEQRTYIMISLRQARGTSLADTDRFIRSFEERLRPMPEVSTYESTVSAMSGSIRVNFPEELELTSVPLAVEEQLQAFSSGRFGGLSLSIRGVGPGFSTGGMGGSSPNYRIKILGYNYQKVEDIAEALAEKLVGNTRIGEVDTNASSRGYSSARASELTLTPDRDLLALHELSARDVTQLVTAATRSRELSPRTIRVAGEEMRFAPKYEGFEEMDSWGLLQSTLYTPDGRTVRLGDVATIDERRVLSEVRRENQQYERTVGYEFRGPSKLGDKIRDDVLAAMYLPPGYTIDTNTGYFIRADERRQIWGLIGMGILLVFMVTAALFESLKQPLVVLLTVPMALIGVFLIFFYLGATFTREAYIGVVMMSGIVVNNAILLVDHVNQLRRKAGLGLHDALVRGSVERVRPILMTSLTTICGLLPLVLFSETADSRIWNALANTLIGGLSSSMFLVLTVTPALYYLFEARAEKKRLVLAGTWEEPVRTGPPLWKRAPKAVGRFAMRAPVWTWRGLTWAPKKVWRVYSGRGGPPD
ncbi:MAG: efflux RND transporter permease subunit [Gemmatimonadota bacterium]